METPNTPRRRNPENAYRPLSHFRVRKAEDSNSSVKELKLQPLSMVVPISQHCCGLIYVEFSTYTSSKDTNLSLQILIEYYETKRRYPNAYFVT